MVCYEVLDVYILLFLSENRSGKQPARNRSGKQPASYFWKTIFLVIKSTWADLPCPNSSVWPGQAFKVSVSDMEQL